MPGLRAQFIIWAGEVGVGGVGCMSYLSKHTRAHAQRYARAHLRKAHAHARTHINTRVHTHSHSHTRMHNQPHPRTDVRTHTFGACAHLHAAIAGTAHPLHARDVTAGVDGCRGAGAACIPAPSSQQASRQCGTRMHGLTKSS